MNVKLCQTEIEPTFPPLYKGGIVFSEHNRADLSEPSVESIYRGGIEEKSHNSPQPNPPNNQLLGRQNVELQNLR